MRETRAARSVDENRSKLTRARLLLTVFLQSHPFAFVTDPSRAFVLGVVTRDDLQKFVARRGAGSGSGSNGRASGNGGGDAMDTDAANVTATAGAPAGVAGGHSLQAQMVQRRLEEEERKNRTLSELLLMLDGYTPLVSSSREEDCRHRCVLVLLLLTSLLPITAPADPRSRTR